MLLIPIHYKYVPNTLQTCSQYVPHYYVHIKDIYTAQHWSPQHAKKLGAMYDVPQKFTNWAQLIIQRQQSIFSKIVWMITTGV